jgi:hypothetical protein
MSGIRAGVLLVAVALSVVALGSSPAAVSTVAQNGMTLRGEDLAKSFGLRYGIWIVGMKDGWIRWDYLPEWVQVSPPESTKAPEALAWLRKALARTPVNLRDYRVIGAQGDAAKQAAEEANGFRLDELAGTDGKGFAVVPAVWPWAPAVTATASAPGTRVAAPSATMVFSSRFVEDHCAQMAERFGVVFVNTGIGRQELKPDQRLLSELQAAAVLNDALQGSYETLLLTANPKVFRIADKTTATKDLITFHCGAASKDVPLTEELRAQIIPFKYLKAEQMRSDLGPLLSGDSNLQWDRVHNCLMLVDTAAKINRLLQIIERLEAGASPPRTERVVLKKAKVADVAQAINAKYPHRRGGIITVAGAPAAEAPRTAPAATRPIYATADERENVLILTAPTGRMDEVLSEVQKMEEEAR